MTDRYALIGNPEAHRKSPLIHAEFARSTGEEVQYGLLASSTQAALAALRKAG